MPTTLSSGPNPFAYALRVTHEPGPSDVIIGRAIVWYLAANVTFFALMGYYETRLSWTIVPPLLVLMGYEIGELESALQGRAKTALIVCVTALAGCYAAYWLARAGPYS